MLTLTLIRTALYTWCSVIHMIESRNLFPSSCKKFCNSVNRYKSVTFAIFVVGWKKRVAAFGFLG